MKVKVCNTCAADFGGIIDFSYYNEIDQRCEFCNEEREWALEIDVEPLVVALHKANKPCECASQQ